MNKDRAEVDELILELADYKNDYADMAAEKLLRKCSTSWEAYPYLQDAYTMPSYPAVHVSNCPNHQKNTSANTSVSEILVGVCAAVTLEKPSAPRCLVNFCATAIKTRTTE